LMSHSCSSLPDRLLPHPDRQDQLQNSARAILCKQSRSIRFILNKQYPHFLQPYYGADKCKINCLSAYGCGDLRRFSSWGLNQCKKSGDKSPSSIPPLSSRSCPIGYRLRPAYSQFFHSGTSVRIHSQYCGAAVPPALNKCSSTKYVFAQPREVSLPWIPSTC
jgi:hypothetical protein